MVNQDRDRISNLGLLVKTARLPQMQGAHTRIVHQTQNARAREGAGRDGRVPLRELRRRPLGGEETARGRHEPGAAPGRAEAPGRVQGRAPPVLAVARRPRGPGGEQPLGTRGQAAGGGPQVEPRLAVRQGRGDARRVHSFRFPKAFGQQEATDGHNPDSQAVVGLLPFLVARDDGEVAAPSGLRRL